MRTVRHKMGSRSSCASSELAGDILSGSSLSVSRRPRRVFDGTASDEVFVAGVTTHVKHPS